MVFQSYGYYRCWNTWEKRRIVVGMEGARRAVINLWKKGATVRHSPRSYRKGTTVRKTRCLCCPRIAHLSSKYGTTNLAFIFKMSSVMDGTIFLYFTPFCTSKGMLIFCNERKIIWIPSLIYGLYYGKRKESCSCRYLCEFFL